MSTTNAVSEEPMGGQKYTTTMPVSAPVQGGNTPMNVPIENEYTMSIGSRPKLYDLNKNFTNFEIEFLVQAERPNEAFFVYIMPQDQLDKVDLKDIPMKAVEGKISGKVSNNNDTYQNYFLILKTENPEETKVHIKTTTVVLPLSHTLTTTPAPVQETTSWTPETVTTTAPVPVPVPAAPAAPAGFFQRMSKSPILYYVKMVLILVVVLYVLYTLYKWMFPSSTATATAAAALIPEWIDSNKENWDYGDDEDCEDAEGEDAEDEAYAYNQEGYPDAEENDEKATDNFEEGSIVDAEQFRQNLDSLFKPT